MHKIDNHIFLCNIRVDIILSIHSVAQDFQSCTVGYSIQHTQCLHTHAVVYRLCLALNRLHTLACIV